MFEIEDIRDWRGRDVIDESGGKVGTLEAVYVDTLTDLPSFATIKIGLPTRQRLVFVPLDGATVAPGHLRVAHPKKQIKSAPAIDTDGELFASAEPEVFAHYDLLYEAGPEERRLARR
ncbi:PRC-barrel domain containing protein [Actinomadura darangshiensis]|uniref:PRC-barrel domain containing protein n=1 Tax=Actinomadura darangshiensis TaxID=705336 RepID=A0A4V2YT75_9ACTN|nr:PRC-barrel domain-containing protein [Actinomadura darangshiensis]TDD72777.1 PRC-barrel domain containing protein [Actinomadura darangshiensis]